LKKNFEEKAKKCCVATKKTCVAHFPAYNSNHAALQHKQARAWVTEQMVFLT
jgi:hypothetical protein